MRRILLLLVVSVLLLAGCTEQTQGQIHTTMMYRITNDTCVVPTSEFYTVHVCNVPADADYIPFIEQSCEDLGGVESIEEHIRVDVLNSTSGNFLTHSEIHSREEFERLKCEVN